MSTFGYISVSEAVELTGYTDGRIRQLLRADLLKGRKTGPRNWLVEKKDAQRIKAEKGRTRKQSA